ncbi:MAG: TRAP transporter TatT component family protein [Candidatus Poribacteria bacterium]|nr:TRAP transporter TatT component family protein [Candidatus Poribacteria bacterium]
MASHFKTTAFKSFVVLILFSLMGCSVTKLTVNQTVKVFAEAAQTFDKEHDLALADAGIMANLKTFEGLLEISPDNETLLILTARSFALYAFAFVEDKMERAAARGDFRTEAEMRARAIDYYGRSRQYGLRLLSRSNRGLTQVLDGAIEPLERTLKKLKKKHLPALFWTAYAWGGLINLQQDDPMHLVDLAKVEVMMKRVITLDETFFFGGAHLFYSVYYGSRSPQLGGEPELAKAHLQKVDAINGGKLLISKLFLARYYAYPTQNRALYRKALQEIRDASIDIFPEQRIANAVAKARAERWLAQIDDLFDEEDSHSFQ